MENLYATAIQRLLASGAKEETVVKNLVAHLTEKGRLKLLPAIKRSLETLTARNASQSPSVEVAKKADAHGALQAAKSAGITAEEAVVNPILLSGWRARSKGMLVDQSGKRALTDMYRAIVKN